MGTNDYVAMLQNKHNKMMLSKAETAQELNVSQATIDRLRKSGAIKSKKVGGQIFFTLATIAEYVAA
ncbi:MAG: helix-turn-helix domain-containing protein [Sulfuricurvum sp.]|nr:helix-turn-helix domain-containing protein [Sulfuricurvum sp.]